MSTVNLSSSRSRTSTPVRAITSTLSSASSPSIPAATQNYEPLVKAVLRHRLLFNIFLYSAIFSWIQAVTWRTWCHGGLSKLGIGKALLTPILPTTLALAGTNWVVGSLPLIVLRKVYLTAHRTSAASPSKLFQNSSSKPSTLRALLAFTTSAIGVAIVHVVMAHVYETDVRGDPRLGIFVKSKKHPYYLNGRLLFLLLSQVTVSLGFFLRHILLDRFVFRWSLASSPVQRWPFRLSDLAKMSLTIAIFTFLCLTLSTIFFGFARIALPLLYRLPLLPYILRSFTAHFLKGSWTLFLPLRHFSLLVRAFFLGLTTLVTWEFSDLLFDSFVAQPILVAQGTPDPFLTLVSGLTSSDAYCKYCAYSELKRLTVDPSPVASARRTALFGDTKYNLWSRLLREGLFSLGRDYQTFLRRGKATDLSPNPPAPAAVPVPQPATPTPLIKKPIFKTTPQSPIRTVVDSFAADGSFSQAVDATAEAAQLPELFRSMHSIVPSSVAKDVEMKQGPNMITRVREHGRKLLGPISVQCAPLWARNVVGIWGAWWQRERVNKVVEACLPAREVDVLVIEVLSHLTCASLTEDRYGAVQRDIPRILEAMLSFLSAVQEYQLEINGLYVAPAADQNLSAQALQEREVLRVEVEKAGEVLSLVGDALKEGVARIVRTFGDRLLAYKFPPRISAKLQGFLDYC